MEILFRADDSNKEEYHICKEVFGNACKTQRSKLAQNTTVVGRYSVLPYYSELQNDLKNRHSKLINSTKQHEWIADVMQWYDLLKIYTPATWEYTKGLDKIPESEQGYVIKGKTNSRKHDWRNRMYASDKADLQRVLHNLAMDDFIWNQGLVIREFVPLQKIDEGINRLPISNEWRVFIWHRGRQPIVIACDFYWSSTDLRPKNYKHERYLAQCFALEIARSIPSYIAPNFYVLDVARSESGEWLLIEVNDGQMSGLSEIDPLQFYTTLKAVSDACD